MSNYLTDQAINQLADDALFFSDFHPALKRILTTAQTPLTVGIFGTWGSGKTSLLRTLRDDIEGESKALARTVWFTAWKYDRQDALWRSLILRVLEAMYPREHGPGPRELRPKLRDANEQQQRLIDLLEKLEESVYQTVAWEEAGERQVDRWKFLSSSGMAGLKLAGLAAALGGGGPAPTAADAAAAQAAIPVEEIKAAASAFSRETKEYYRRQLVHMEQFESLFAEAVGLIEQARLIIFVDDLDRCLPEKAIDVLEAIKLFLEVPGVVFVLGMDREVVERGIEARYGRYFRDDGGRQELPISGDSYLQKIVQLPFHLPALAIERLDAFMAGLDTELDELARQVFARGLYPNPRQVKRALNIYHLLQEIARQREGRPLKAGGLPPEAIAWPLLAKTVVIQTQYPGLYQLWRQYPLVVQMLEEEFSREEAASRESAYLRGHGEEAAQARLAADPRDEAEQPPADAPAQASAGRPVGGVLGTYLEDRQKYARLARLLSYPPKDGAAEGRQRARFAGLTREQMSAYTHLAGAAEAEEAEAVDAPLDLLAALLSGEPVQMQDAAARLQSEEAAGEGPKHAAHRSRLIQVLSNPGEPTARRMSAGEALGWIGDRREGVCTREPDLIPITEELSFLMGEKPWRVTVPQPFAIARYPASNAQFRFFVKDGGYTEKWHKCWTDEGWATKNEAGWQQPRLWDDSRFNLDNQPVLVSWYEAHAYAAWLAQETGLLYRLPTEAEWERAARHTDGRIYPWGNEWREGAANSEEAGLRRPSPPGVFALGAAVCGAQDMGGNVWEWCQTRFQDENGREYPQPWADDDRETTGGGEGVWRVLKGGGWGSDRGSCTAAARLRNAPYYWTNYYGVRVVVSPFISPSGR